jgi:beta-ketoacyl synthase, N-terminal domain
MEKNKVVVTGLGVVSSIGENVLEFWRNCLDGKVGTSKK